ncbi:uncharacterized protein LOC134092710 [Sardina pilchardus]|uniref:uncharacterized protein LOC134092710 n=1 Tax=Sardina pilchardus TaxID=27697 RepID=UPI002E0F6835
MSCEMVPWTSPDRALCEWLNIPEVGDQEDPDWNWVTLLEVIGLPNASRNDADRTDIVSDWYREVEGRLIWENGLAREKRQRKRRRADAWTLLRDFLYNGTCPERLLGSNGKSGDLTLLEFVSMFVPRRRITVDHQRRHEKNGAQEKIQRDNEKRKPQLNGSSDVNIQRAVALRGLPFYLHEDDGTFIKTWDGSSDVNIQHTVALRGLPFYLHEDDGTFIKTWDVSQSEFKMRKPSPICRRLDLALQAGILHIYLFCFRSTFAGTNRILAYPSDAPGSWSDWLKDYPSVQRHLTYANSSRLLSSLPLGHCAE